jgi:hypothetical protein
MSTTNLNFFKKTIKQNGFVTLPAKRCMIAENCNRYPFLTIARFHDHKPVFLNQLLHFLSNHLKLNS